MQENKEEVEKGNALEGAGAQVEGQVKREGGAWEGDRAKRR